MCGALCTALCMGAQPVPVRVAHSQDAMQPPAQKGTTSTAVPASTPPETAQTLTAYVGQQVSSVELAGRPDLDERELLPLLAQHAGEPFDRDKVERTVAALKATGKFQNVQLSVIPDIEGVRVLLILQPGLYFGIYEFPGSKEFPYSRLLQVANYPPDGPYNQRDVTQASDALTKFFKQNGYFLATVSPKIEPDAAHGIVNVRFQVEAGPKAKFGKVILSGTSEEVNARLQAKLKSKLARLRSSAIREGKPYSLKAIQNATTYMQNTLVKQDRLGAQVQMIGAEYDTESNRADVTFHVAEGPLVRVRVEGAHVWKATQRRLIPLYQQVGVDDELVQEGRNNLISHFQSKGYFDAAVETSINKQGTGETVLYKIVKGPKHKVSSVSIDGNKTLGDPQLLSHVTVKKASFSRAGRSAKSCCVRAQGIWRQRIGPRDLAT